MSDELASKPVTLECPRSGKELVCYAERIAVVGGERYLVAFPKVRCMVGGVSAFWLVDLLVHVYHLKKCLCSMCAMCLPQGTRAFRRLAVPTNLCCVSLIPVHLSK